MPAETVSKGKEGGAAMRERYTGIALAALGVGILLSFVLPTWLLIVILVGIVAVVGFCVCRH